MKPLVFKQNGTNWWYTLHRDNKGKLTSTASASWGRAIIEALAAVHIYPDKPVRKK